MKNGIQSLFLSLGNESCFFLQLLNIAEKETGMPLDVQTSAWLCSIKNYIYINWTNLLDEKNFLVKEHAKILELLTGKKWSYVKESPNKKKKKNEYIIDEWQNGSSIHFDSKDFHSLQVSNTVQNGKIVSRRVFKVV